MKEYIDIAGLIPNFSSLASFPGFEYLTAEYLSLLFITVMLLISLWFLLIASWSFVKISSRISRLKSIIADGNKPKEKRQSLADKLWQEFKQTLVEVTSIDANNNANTSLYNTIDSSHSFNVSTLAPELTENRLLAAVPGFLTGLGVLGTFIGLQLGLSELNIGNDVAVEEMKTGLAQVISGAKIAFLTSVWGVFLSLVFNFIEKWFERGVRAQIKTVQSRVDGKYPRLSPERQLQQISDHSAEMRESLQHLGEKIGDRLQTAIADLGDKIAEPMAGLADKTESANENVLNSLIQEFLEQFKEAGGDQAKEMKGAIDAFSNAINSLDSSMAQLLKQLEDNQKANVGREKELLKNMSDKVDELAAKSNEQHKMLAEFVGKTFADIGKGETERNDSTENLLKRLEDAMQNQLDASAKLIMQGENLQKGLDASVEGNIEASKSLKAGASELEQASQHLKGTGESIKKAGSHLSGVISETVDSTGKLAKANQAVQVFLNAHQDELNQQHQKLNDAAKTLDDLFSKARNSFDVMDERQKSFLVSLEDHFGNLSEAIFNSLNTYTKDLSDTTDGHLKSLADNTSSYANSLNKTIKSLQGVIDDVETKAAESK